MKRVFDPVEAIFELVDYIYSEYERLPSVIVVSPNTHRRLLEMGLPDCKVESVMKEGIPAAVVSTPWGVMQLVIDELLEDTRVEVDG